MTIWIWLKTYVLWGHGKDIDTLQHFYLVSLRVRRHCWRGIHRHVPRRVRHRQAAAAPLLSPLLGDSILNPYWQAISILCYLSHITHIIHIWEIPSEANQRRCLKHSWVSLFQPWSFEAIWKNILAHKITSILRLFTSSLKRKDMFNRSTHRTKVGCRVGCPWSAHLRLATPIDSVCVTTELGVCDHQVLLLFHTTAHLHLSPALCGQTRHFSLPKYWILIGTDRQATIQVDSSDCSFQCDSPENEIE